MKIKGNTMATNSKETYNYKISIILPVFNEEKNLERSFKSMIDQTLDNIEIIYIDDGSTDKSLEILGGLEEKYDFVKVLKQNHLGSGKARNYGIREAKGEYIGFLDADDYFEDNDALERMYNIAHKNNANMVSANIIQYSTKLGKFIPFWAFESFESESVIKPEEYGIPWAFYKNIFKKEFLMDNEIFFPDLLRGQDPVFQAEALTKVDKIYTVDAVLYAYDYRDNDHIIKINQYRKLYDQLKHYKMVFDCFEEPRFKERQFDFHQRLFKFIEKLDKSCGVSIIKASREIFAEDEDLLKRIENFVYIKCEDVPEVIELLDENPKVTYIIPVENKNEKHLERSITSVLNQTINNIELICVNINADKDLLDKAANGDSRVKILDAENEDYAHARNLGLKEAKGDYVFFMYANDVLYKTTTLKLLNNALFNGSDVVFTNVGKFKNLKDSKRKNVISFYKLMKEHYPLSYITSYDTIYENIFESSFSTYFKFYKREYLIENGFDFIENSYDYDILFHLQTILSTDKISIRPNISYTLNNHGISIHDFDLYSFQYVQDFSKIDGIFEILDKVEELLKEKNIYTDFMNEFFNFKVQKVTEYLNEFAYNGIDNEYSSSYYLKSKEYLENMKNDLINENVSDEKLLNEIETILSSSDLKDYKTKAINLRICELNEESNEIAIQNEMLEKENEVPREQKAEELKKNEELKEENENLKAETKKLRKTNKKILSSNSWKMTRTMRKIVSRNK